MTETFDLFINRLTLLVFLMVTGCNSENHAPIDSSDSPFVYAMHLAFNQGDYHEALNYADSASFQSPDLAELDYVRGQIYSSLRQYDEAEQSFVRVIDLDAAYPGAWYHRGHNAFLGRKFRDALRFYDKERQLLEDQLSEPSGVGAKDLPNVYAQIGRTYYLLGVQDSARIAFQEALAADSSLPVAHAWLSETLDNQGDIEGALKHAKLALEGNPLEFEYGYRVGQLLFQLGQAKEALPYLSRVVQFLPGHEGANFNLGRALQVLGEVEEGQMYINRVQEIRALQEKAQIAERSVELFPTEPKYWIELAGYMAQMGHVDRAEEALNAAYTLQPDNASLLNDLANMAFSRGDTLAAIARYNKLLTYQPDFAAGWLNLGVIQAMSGNKKEAQKAWQTVLRINPEDAEARSYLETLEQ